MAKQGRVNMFKNAFVIGAGSFADERKRKQ